MIQGKAKFSKLLKIYHLIYDSRYSEQIQRRKILCQNIYFKYGMKRIKKKYV
jgi:hypothetical protein